jgi:hypothetical protein
MLLKISECFLCGRYYRTGLIREVTKKELLTGVKKSYDESKVLVCIDCLGHIENKEGVTRLSSTASYFGDIIDGDKLRYTPDPKDIVRISHDSGILNPSKPKKERKPRVSKKIVNSELAKAMKMSPSEVQVDDEDVDNKEVKEPKKRGRKPKEKVEPTEPKKRGRKPRAKPESEQPSPPILGESSTLEDVVIPTSMPSLKDQEPETSETVELKEPSLASANKPKFITRPDGSTVNREVLKSSVREALASKSDIMYSEIAAKLFIDEALVGELCDEIDVEG